MVHGQPTNRVPLPQRPAVALRLTPIVSRCRRGCERRAIRSDPPTNGAASSRRSLEGHRSSRRTRGRPRPSSSARRSQCRRQCCRWQSPCRSRHERRRPRRDCFARNTIGLRWSVAVVGNAAPPLWRRGDRACRRRCASAPSARGWRRCGARHTLAHCSYGRLSRCERMAGGDAGRGLAGASGCSEATVRKARTIRIVCGRHWRPWANLRPLGAFVAPLIAYQLLAAGFPPPPSGHLTPSKR